MDYLPTTSLVRETTDPQPPVQIQQGGATVPESVPQLNSTMVQKKGHYFAFFSWINLATTQAWWFPLFTWHNTCQYFCLVKHLTPNSPKIEQHLPGLEDPIKVALATNLEGSNRLEQGRVGYSQILQPRKCVGGWGNEYEQRRVVVVIPCFHCMESSATRKLYWLQPAPLMQHFFLSFSW